VINLVYLCFVGGADHFFSVKMEHSGIFCGIGEGLQYASPTVAHIDYCNKDSWSLLWIEDILKQLGYEIDEKLHIYWCLPGKAICEGLVLIKSDADILQMIRAADNHKTLFLMVDHSDFLRNLREDVTMNRRQQVAPPIYPKKKCSGSGGGGGWLVADSPLPRHCRLCRCLRREGEGVRKIAH
jgi:hypothetical protein